LANDKSLFASLAVHNIWWVVESHGNIWWVVESHGNKVTVLLRKNVPVISHKISSVKHFLVNIKVSFCIFEVF